MSNMSEDEKKEVYVGKKRKSRPQAPQSKDDEIEMDHEALERARALVSQAKKRQKRKARKKKSKN